MNTNANISEFIGNTALSERDARVHDKLRRELGPTICGALCDDSVIEIMLNPDGALWIERLGKGMERAGFMTPSQAEAAIATVAAMLKTVVDWREPILLCELPLDGSRFTAKVPPIVSAPSFTIRRHAIQVFRLADYVEQGIMTAAQSAAIRRAVAERQNILVVGGTGSGKTTLVNAVIAEMAEIAPEHRLIIIEDTRELQCLSPNYVAYRANPRQPQSACVALALARPPGPADRRRGPRRRSARHPQGLEHRPSRRGGDHPRQQRARRADPARPALRRGDARAAAGGHRRGRRSDRVHRQNAERPPDRGDRPGPWLGRKRLRHVNSRVEGAMPKPSPSTVLVILALAAGAAVLLDPGLARAASSNMSQGMPWDGPLTRLTASIQGPVAYAVSLMGIVVAGASLVFGGEINEFVRRVIMLVLVVSLIMFASNILSSLFSAGAVIA